MGSVGVVSERLFTIKEAAELAGVTPATLRRWAKTGVIPELDGKQDGLSASAVAHARIVARLRERGHSLDEVRRASQEGRLAYGFVEDIFSPDGAAEIPFAEAAEMVGLEPALVERIWSSVGFAMRPDKLTEEDVQALRYISAVLAAGFPLVAFLQLIRIYGQSLSHIADLGTIPFYFPETNPPRSEELAEWLHWAWERSDITRLGLVQLAKSPQQLTFTSKGI